MACSSGKGAVEIFRFGKITCFFLSLESGVAGTNGGFGRVCRLQVEHPRATVFLSGRLILVQSAAKEVETWKGEVN